jgi:LysR family hydrogen peroxide-inducible transcriptional activator
MIATSTEIEYFVEVFQTRHVSKAAIRLGVTQPTLTLSLQKLEEKVGAKLFHRTKQGVVPTEQGSLLYRKSLALLENWNEIHKGIQQSKNEIFGHFKLGCHQSVGAYTLPKLFEQLHKFAPGI